MFQKLKRNYRISRLIRNAIDTYPDGICFAAADGRPILANKSINSICLRLTGSTITNANAMWEELRKTAEPQPSDMVKNSEKELLLCKVDDTAVWQFQKQWIEISSDRIVQYEASDITELYNYQNRLRENNIRAAELHDRQRELLKNIVQNNIEKEILKAKMQIHDQFGRCLIMTRNALADNADDKDSTELFAAWQEVIADMENAAVMSVAKASSPEKELVQVADLIGCKVKFHGKQPSERKALLLLYAAIREALTNAVRHAGADQLMIEIEEVDGEYTAVISSNGKTDVMPIREGGGLRNLRVRLEQEGATMNIRCDNGVVLELTIPKR